MPLLRQFTSFLFVGVAATAVHYSVLALVVSVLGQRPVVGSMLGFLAGGIVSYLLNYRYTFASNEAHHVASTKFFIVAGVGFVFNTLLMTLFTEYWSWHYLVAQAVTTVIILAWHFVGNRTWTFRSATR